MGMGRYGRITVPRKLLFRRCWWAAEGLGRDGHGPLWADYSAAEASFSSLLVGRRGLGPRWAWAAMGGLQCRGSFFFVVAGGPQRAWAAMGMGRYGRITVPRKLFFCRCWWAAEGLGRDGHGPLWADYSAAEALFLSLLVG